MSDIEHMEIELQTVKGREFATWFEGLSLEGKNDYRQAIKNLNLKYKKNETRR